MHVFLQGCDFCGGTHDLKQVTQALSPGNRSDAGGGGKLCGVEPFSEFGEHRRNLIQPAGLILIANEVNRRRFCGSDDQGTAWCVEVLNRNLPQSFASHERHAYFPARDWKTWLLEKDLKFLRPLVSRPMVLRRREKAGIVGQIEAPHQCRNELIGWKTCD